MKISFFKPNDKNPRYIKEQSFDKLIDSILCFPEMLQARGLVFVREDKRGLIIGSNQRFRALTVIYRMDEEERQSRIASKVEEPARQNHLKTFWADLSKTQEIPSTWQKDVTGWTDGQIKEFVIKDNLHSGDFDFDVLANEWDTGELESWGLELPTYEDDPEDMSGEGADDNKYTSKVESPTYEPRGEKPELDNLIDAEKTTSLIEKIKASGVSEAEKKFLIKAAQRHLVFQYDKIADYYAHSGPEMQDLMEASALVIVDFNRAIEDGYIQVVSEMQQLIEIDNEQDV